MTTTSATLSPINTILNVDILWSIFWENTEMVNDNLRRPTSFIRNLEERKSEEQNSPLTTLRRTSQVCRLWREIILGSSALWGRVIDLNVLMWKRRACWRKEVLERAGEAPLHIAGTLRVQSKSSEVFFKRLLDERWSSIRKLSVAVPKRREHDQFTPAEMWDPLQRPSPDLEVFKLFGAECDEKCQMSDLPLFAHTAPALYDFGLHETLPGFSLQAPWLKQLQELELNDVSGINAANFIAALSDMPCLEGLYIHQLAFKSKRDERPQFRLPLVSLKRLEILDTFESCLFVLKNAALPSKCVLFMEVNDDIEPGSLRKADVEDMCHELSGYMKNHLMDRTESLQSLFLSVHQYNLCFDFNPWITPRTEHIYYTYSFGFLMPSTFVYDVFKVLFDPKLFAQIETFTLGEYQDVGMEPSILKQSVVFWSSLTSVTTLIIRCRYMDELLVIQEKYPDIFPNLQILDYSKRTNPTIIQQFLTFMLKRIDTGRPVAILKLKIPSKTMTIADLSPLDVVQGLKVIWSSDLSNNKYEYICGSGKEEEQTRVEVALLLPFHDFDHVDA